MIVTAIKHWGKKRWGFCKEVLSLLTEETVNMVSFISGGIGYFFPDSNDYALLLRIIFILDIAIVILYVYTKHLYDEAKEVEKGYTFSASIFKVSFDDYFECINQKLDNIREVIEYRKQIIADAQNNLSEEFLEGKVEISDIRKKEIIKKQTSSIGDFKKEIKALQDYKTLFEKKYVKTPLYSLVFFLVSTKPDKNIDLEIKIKNPENTGYFTNYTSIKDNIDNSLQGNSKRSISPPTILKKHLPPNIENTYSNPQLVENYLSVNIKEIKADKKICVIPKAVFLVSVQHTTSFNIIYNSKQSQATIKSKLNLDLSSKRIQTIDSNNLFHHSIKRKDSEKLFM